jgi:gluconokinase
MVIVVMGVAGAGKTTVGSRLAEELGWTFVDADDVHPDENVAHMRRGEPLTDEHRRPWLRFLARLIADHAADGRPLVLACSALSQAHREVLLAEVGTDDDVALVHLHADDVLLARRLHSRQGHFFPPHLMATQLAALEAPGDADGIPLITLDAALPVDTLVEEIRSRLTV